jgi:hypothetical protein
MENNYLSYTISDQNALVVATVRRGINETPVWIQTRWEQGEYAKYVRNNGCGHCCAAMAARLCGVSDITPYTEYEHCRAIFGEPSPDKLVGHFLSPCGIYLSLRALGVDATLYGYPENSKSETADKIHCQLKNGKMIIFYSHPETPDNPFSSGSHYVLLLGLDEEGNILVANSSTKARSDTLGIQTATKKQIREALSSDGMLYTDLTWGHEKYYRASAGYIVIE